MKYRILSKEGGSYTETLNIGDEFFINSIKYKIKSTGVKIKQQPITNESYFDLSKNYIVCLELNKLSDWKIVCFKYEIIK